MRRRTDSAISAYVLHLPLRPRTLAMPGECRRRPVEVCRSDLALVFHEPGHGVVLDRVDQRSRRRRASSARSIRPSGRCRPTGTARTVPARASLGAGVMAGGACLSKRPFDPSGHGVPVLGENRFIAVRLVKLPGNGDDRVPPPGGSGHHRELVIEVVLDAAAVGGEVGDPAVVELVVAHRPQPFPAEAEHVPQSRVAVEMNTW